MKKNKKVLEIFFSSYLLVRLISTYLAAFCGCLLLPSFQAGQGGTREGGEETAATEKKEKRRRAEKEEKE